MPDRRVALMTVTVMLVAGLAALASTADADGADSTGERIRAVADEVCPSAAPTPGPAAAVDSSGMAGMTGMGHDPAGAAETDCRATASPDPVPAGATAATTTTAPPTAAGAPATVDAQVPDTGANGPVPPAIPADGANAAPAAAPLDVLAKDCSESGLEPHDGFQKAPRCVSTSFGEVPAAGDDPSLIIAEAPRQVRAGRAFDLSVSTRNLVRDRFLAAGRGGYYAESSVLNDEGLVRGHVHTACRMLDSRRVAPDPAPVPAFFVATEDGGGGAAPDTVTVRVAGLPARGMAQCAVWAGDGSHRLPMMERANQVPAFDIVRIAVR